jgi:hypothetical protein
MKRFADAQLMDLFSDLPDVRDQRLVNEHETAEALWQPLARRNFELFSPTAFDLMQEYQAWASGAFERIMADQQQIMATTTSALGSPPLTPSASEKEPEQPARPTRSKTAAM